METIASVRVKTPASVFKKCPSCESPNLMKCDSEAFCTYCDWNSVAAHESCLDDFFMKNPTSFDLHRT